jgi:threonine/homoserine/homoserine lactone efflux protein
MQQWVIDMHNKSQALKRREERMAQAVETVSTNVEQMMACGSRSTPLNPLTWILAVVFAALVISVAVRAPLWSQVFLTVVAGSLVVVFLAAYVYLLVKDPDALRSERFRLPITNEPL